jgi:outer membrane receptor protein involved in Fe transport
MPFPNAPKWQLISNAVYEFPISEKLNAIMGADASYRSATKAIFSNVPVYDIPSYTLVGVSAGVESIDKRWRVQLWGKNIFNEFYIVNAVHAIDTFDRMVGAPASYGVTLSARF